jgi:hypothetical protein
MPLKAPSTSPKKIQQGEMPSAIAFALLVPI